MNPSLDASPSHPVASRAGPSASDWLLGAGVGYLLSVPLLALLARGARAGDWPLALVWCIAILVNGPHYGATLLRVYPQRAERRRYALFSLWATGALALAFVAGVHRPLVASALVTLYFSWSPWHFAGQSYGIALLFLRRGGVEPDRSTRRWLYASFALSFGLSFLALHVAGSSHVQAPTRGGVGAEIGLLRLGIPPAAAGPLALALLCAYAVSLGLLGLRLGRLGSLRLWGPVASLLACQALWFALPAWLDLSGGWSARTLAFAAIWISAAHSLQYLWVTFHYARRTGTGSRLPGYLLRATLLGNAVIALPGLLFAPRWLGSGLTWELGLSSLVFAVVNLHHFVLDGAVWKLRDGRVARRLLRARLATPASPPVLRGRGAALAARALWGVCALCLGLELGELAWQQAENRGEPRLAARLLGALGSAGRDHPAARIRLGRELLEAGDPERARAQFAASLASHASAAAWGGTGRAYEREGRWREAARAYESGIAVAPQDVPLLRSAGRMRLRLDEPEPALVWLEQALRLAPEDARVRSLLVRAREGARWNVTVPDVQLGPEGRERARTNSRTPGERD